MVHAKPVRRSVNKQAATSRQSHASENVPAEADGILQKRAPVTRKGRKVVESRQSQVHEPSKKSLFMKGSKASVYVQSLLKELHCIRKPNSAYLSSRGQANCHPIEDPQTAEYLCQKNDCSLFCLGSSNKKHPFRLVFGRMFADSIFDTYEFDVEAYRPRSEFPAVPAAALGSKPLVVVQGPAFEASELNRNVKNILADFFCGPKAPQLCLQGIDHAIVLTAVDSAGASPISVRFRHYRLDYVKTDTDLPRVEMRELGPSFDLRLGRHKQPDAERIKLSMKVPKEVTGVAKKNVSTNVLGEKRGRVFVDSQDLTKLHTPHHHGTKRRKVE